MTKANDGLVSRGGKKKTKKLCPVLFSVLCLGALCDLGLVCGAALPRGLAAGDFVHFVFLIRSAQNRVALTHMGAARVGSVAVRLVEVLHHQIVHFLLLLLAVLFARPYRLLIIRSFLRGPFHTVGAAVRYGRPRRGLRGGGFR